MDSSPTLVELLLDISEWVEKSQTQSPWYLTMFQNFLQFSDLDRLKSGYKVRIPFSSTDVRILAIFVRRIGVDSDFCLRMSEMICSNDIWKHRFEPSNYELVAQMVGSLLDGLREVLQVSHFIQPDDGIHTKIYISQQTVGALQRLIMNKSSGLDTPLEEIRYFLAIFSDRPFEAAEDEQTVQCLWAQLEGLVNQLGRFVYSYIFTPSHQLEVNRVDDYLLKPVNILKAMIVEFVSTSTYTAVCCDVDSFFIIDSFLNDLNDLLNRSRKALVVQELYNQLMLTWSLLKEHVERKEFEEIVGQIKEMAYGGEYVINSFLIGDIPFWYVTIRLTSVINRLEELTIVIQNMLEGDKKHGIRAVPVQKSFNPHGSLLQVSRGGNKVDECIVGFEKEREHILEQLLRDSQNLQIISIFGMPGLGKTTLAKHLHNHRSVAERFDKRSWCVVSQEYQRKRLLDGILEDLGEKVEANMDEGETELKVYQTLKGRRYLITLDDIWSSKAWDDLRRCFPDDENGSRILLTSRYSNVVTPTGRFSHALPFLSEDDCWKLLEKKVFNAETCPPELEVLGKRIAAKCKGLPLVAAVLGGILSNLPKEPNTWTTVEENLDKYINNDQDNSVMQILELSYKHLPPHLRPCFLYFGVFLEDTEIPVKKLKHLWIAEGFITHKEVGKSRENVAEEYFMELIKRSLVTVNTRGADGRAKSCIVHDLLLEMCLRIAKEKNFLKKTRCDDWKDDLKFTRLVFQYSSSRRPAGSQNVRSLILTEEQSSVNVPSVSSMKLLRILCCEVNRSNFSHVTEIDECSVNSRYLAVRTLPERIDLFWNLEYLIIGKGLSISSQMLKMSKLRYIKAYSHVMLLPDCDVSQGNNLEFLSEFWIGDLEEEEMLKYSTHLRRLKCSVGAYRRDCFDLSFLTELESLSLSFGGVSSTIKFSPCIKKLSLATLGFSWNEISVIGALPNLEVLKLRRDSFNGATWETTDDEFKKLRFLKLEDLNLKQWNVSSSEHFPVLERLVIKWCENLSEIPSEIGDIATLQSIELEFCSRRMLESAQRIQQEQIEYGNEGLTVVSYP